MIWGTRTKFFKKTFNLIEKKFVELKQLITFAVPNFSGKEDI